MFKESNHEQIVRLVEDYSDMILRLAMHQVNNRSEAEDITQKVFLKLIHKQPVFQDKNHEKAWLIRVTVNLCKDYFRNSWFRRVVPLTKDHAVSDPSPQSEQDLFSVIYKLPPNYKNVIYLHYFEDLSVSEISEILNTKEGTIMSWLYRAREKLKVLLKGDFCNEQG